MISKKDALNMMDGFLDHYNSMYNAAHKRHSKRSEDYSRAMWYVCKRLKDQIRAWFRENEQATDIPTWTIIKLLNAKQEHYKKVCENDLKAAEDGDDFRLSLFEDHHRLYTICPILKRRLITKFKNDYKNRKENKK